MAPGHVERAEDVVQEGQEVKVRVTDVTPEGKVGLSMLFGADIKPESEGRPSGGFRPRPSFGDSPRFAGGAGRPRPSTGGYRPGGFGGERSSGPRRPFGDRSRSGGFDRSGSGRSSGGFDRNRGGGGRDRGGRGGFDR